jgi:regulator of sigma E protease
MLLTIGAFIVVLGVLIFVHELGHFMTAKAVGIGVPRFSIGLGPVTPLSFRRGETEYVISWIPFGGYVRMATKEDPVLEGDAPEEEFPEDKLFESKPLWARMLVISAGVIMNVLFAWLVYFFISAAYGRAEDPTTRIGAIDRERLPASAATLADLPVGAQILRVNGDTIASREAIRAAFGDITTSEIVIEFANHPPVTLPIDGLSIDARIETLAAMPPLWEPRIATVQTGSAADDAGIRPGDIVLSIGADTVTGWASMVGVLRESAGDTLTLRILRDGEILTLTAVPDERTTRTAAGGEEAVGYLGIGPNVPTQRVRIGAGAAIVEAGRRVASDAQNVWFVLSNMVMGRISPRELGGPVLIGQLSGQTARLGLEVFLSFMALFSVNLAILNILPIPVLDGGHLVFLLIEGVRGKPLSLNLRMRLTQVGLAVLLGIMALAFTNDILRVFGN